MEKRAAKYAKQASESEKAPAGLSISVRGGQMTVGGNEVKGNELDVLILDYCYENALYDGDFDPDSPRSPICFAFAREEGELKPHEKSKEPQAETCAACPKNQFGTADTGRGKACKNIRRMICLSADNLTEDSIKTGDLASFKVPVTSTKAWAYFVKYLANSQELPPFAVVSKISCKPDQKTQVKVMFDVVSPVDEDLMDAVMERRGENGSQSGEVLMRAYDPPAEEAQKDKAKGKGAKGGKKDKGRGGKSSRF